MDSSLSVHDVLTSLTGFLFPFTTATPAITLEIISLMVLAIASVTRYFLHLTWRFAVKRFRTAN